MPALQPPTPFADGHTSSSPYSDANHAATPVDPFTASSTDGGSTSSSSATNNRNDYNNNSSSNNNINNHTFATPMSTNDPSFDILEWYPAYQSCQRFFLDHAQYEPATQAVCALINIRLPSQWPTNPVMSWSGSSSSTGSSTVTPSATPPSLTTGGSSSTSSTSGLPTPFSTHPRASSQLPPKIPSPGISRSGGGGGGGGGSTSSTYHPSPDNNTASSSSPPPFISAVPYIRRLVVTGFDRAPILHGFFGDEWARGVGPLVECERRNYLFAARGGNSGGDGWARCKQQYDAGSGAGADESVPFLHPLDDARPDELVAADQAWGRWRAAMEGWGPSGGGGRGGAGAMVDGIGRGGSGGHGRSSSGLDGSRPFVGADYQRRRRRDADDIDGNRMVDGEIDGYR